MSWLGDAKKFFCGDYKAKINQCIADWIKDNPQGLDADAVKKAIVACFAGPDAPEIDHPDPPDQRICRGPFQRCSNRTGWWSVFGTPNWSPVYNNTGNVAQVVGEWVGVGNEVVAPDCVTDLVFDADLGNHIHYARRTRVLSWWDVRLLVNGAVVQTLGTDIYHYRDERTPTNQSEGADPLQYHMEPTGHANGHRLNIPAGATVQVEARPRYQTSASQDGNYFRTIVGLRSQTTYSFTPREVVIGRA